MKYSTCRPDKPHSALGLCKQCYWSKYYKENKEKVLIRMKDHHITNPENRILIDAKRRAKIRSIPFNIELEDIIIPKVCPVLNIPLKYGKGQFSPNSPSLDRIDNTKGYIKGNIIVISYRANSLKKDATIAELIAVSSFFKTLQEVHPTIQ